MSQIRLVFWSFPPGTLIAALLFVATAATPARAQSAAPPGPAISGYMDFHYTKRQFEDGFIDFHRFVLLFTHAVTDRIRFVLDFLISRRFNVRAGMLLVPVGIINERHEPPVYYGVERPLTDTVIVPSTWFEAGAGVHGEVGRGWRYRAYVMAPLDASGFSADEGIRGGRQKGSEANMRRPAFTGRVEYVGLPGLTAGGSVWTGRSGFDFQPTLEVPVHLVEGDVRYSRDRLELRAQLARVFIERAGELNDRLALRTGVNPNIARQLQGFYVEAGYRVVSSARGELGVFTRYERVDTQFRLPAGVTALEEFNRRHWVVGMTYWPDPDVAVKFDYTAATNRSIFREADVLGIGLGWWF
jgi:hypothetical protein